MGIAFMGPGGSPALGLLADLAGTFSVWYHWEQLRHGGTNHPSVQLAMLFDYAFAIPSVFLGVAYAASLGAALPIAAVTAHPTPTAHCPRPPPIPPPIPPIG